MSTVRVHVFLFLRSNENSFSSRQCYFNYINKMTLCERLNLLALTLRVGSMQVAIWILSLISKTVYNF